MPIQDGPNPKIHTINVFVDEKNNFGSPLGIVLDEEHKIDAKQRQQIATDLNYSETVFIDDRKTGNINVFSPLRECPFSMYAAHGAAWFMHTELKSRINHLMSNDQTIEIFLKEGKTWVRSKIAILPQWNYAEYGSATEIELLRMDDFLHHEHEMVWAWSDKGKGIIRARTFANDWGIPEDEANGSGTMRLAAMRGKSITVVHGKGSVLYANPFDSDNGEVGGMCSIAR
ncbi:MAG: PhzF family phenazine biosynthesis protein [Microgenomates group bacterium]